LFSVGGLLMGSFLDPTPEGVRAVAGTYVAVADPDLVGADLPQTVDMATASSVPLLLVRPEHDFAWVAPATVDLLARCTAADREVEVIEVPGAHHAFETVDATDAARAAIRRTVACGPASCPRPSVPVPRAA
jgi:dienelactone hydrolase